MPSIAPIWLARAGGMGVRTGECRWRYASNSAIFGEGRDVKTIELFAGIGGFRIAADQCGLKTVWANDISELACLVYQDRFGSDAIARGDLRGFLSDIPRHDILTGGFPCQPFSAAGKKAGIRDPRGTLFELIVNVLKCHRPRYFVLENVKRLLTMEKGFHFATILSSIADLEYDIEWRLVNAMCMGLPQNRQRVFIVGALREHAGESAPGYRLVHRDEIFSLGERSIDRMRSRASWSPIENHSSRFPNWGAASDGRFFGADVEFLADAKPIVSVNAVLEDAPSSEFDFTEITRKWVRENTPVNRMVQGVEIISNQAGGARMGYTIFGTSGVAPTLTSTTSRHYERYFIKNRYRRLTNIEYARIQGFPDDHCSAVSPYHQYALYGNAVPPVMASWAIRKILGEGTAGADLPRAMQRELFSYADQG